MAKICVSWGFFLTEDMTMLLRYFLLMIEIIVSERKVYLLYRAHPAFEDHDIWFKGVYSL